MGDRRRPWELVAIGITLVGVVLQVAGWYLISGESTIAQQMPYLASATLPGMSLVIGGAVLLASERRLRHREQRDAAIDDLVALLTEAVGRPGSTQAPEDGDVVALDAGTRYHRPVCSLVEGKPFHPATREEIVTRGLSPCPVCDPPPAP